MKKLSLVIALVGASLLAANVAQAAPNSRIGPTLPAWDSLVHLTAAIKVKRKPLPQSVRNLRLAGGGGPSRVQGSCTYGNDDITHCENCEVDWDDLVMICIANQICYDDDKRVACP